MNRRTFIARAALLSGGGAFMKNDLLAVEKSNVRHPVLGKHKIDKVEFVRANFHWPRLVGKNSRGGVHGQHKKVKCVKLYTDQGAMGWAMSPGKLKEGQLQTTVIGKRVDELIVPSQGIKEGVHRSLDLVLHDLAGVILKKPVYQLLGASGPMASDVYSGMIYLDELEPEDNPSGFGKILENCRWDYDYGYRQLKVKIGRSGKWYPHDEGLEADIKVVKMIHEKFGDTVSILVDANDMYSFQDTIDFLKGVEGVPIYWMEEPFKENLCDARKLKEWMLANSRENTYYSDGEAKPDHNLLKRLGREGVIDVYLTDIAGYGFTPWRKLMPYLIKYKILSSPHTWGSLLKTHYTAHLAAGLGNVITIEGVTCLSDDIDFGNYKIINGKLRVSDDPGFGMKLMMRD